LAAQPEPLSAAQEAASPARAARRLSAGQRREWLLFALFIGPNLLLFAVFTFWPLLYNIYLSFVRWNFLRPRKPFVWLDNYLAVFGSAQFWQIVLNTLVFTVWSVALTLALGLALALLLNQPLRFRNAARAVLFSPVVMAGAVVAVVWTYIFDPRYGLIQELLQLIGLSSPNWLGDPRWAMPAVIIVYVWKNLGYAVVIYLAGLQSIPRELYDAALVDGAGPWARLRHVTLPGLSPVAFFLCVTSVLNTFQSFDIVKVLTDGGPVIATTTLIYHLYELGFVSYDAGKAGVVAVVLFGIMLVLTLIQLRYLERRVSYG
jgi:multiple sugar transport system permease protein/sn-glycerol 3-phosphate transport system permease protein